jgi:hypothetical protein
VQKSAGAHLKNVFWSPAFFGGIGASLQILDPPQADLRFETRLRRNLERRPDFFSSPGLFCYLPAINMDHYSQIASSRDLKLLDKIFCKHY